MFDLNPTGHQSPKAGPARRFHSPALFLPHLPGHIWFALYRKLLFITKHNTHIRVSFPEGCVLRAAQFWFSNPGAGLGQKGNLEPKASGQIRRTRLFRRETKRKYGHACAQRCLTLCQRTWQKQLTLHLAFLKTQVALGISPIFRETAFSFWELTCFCLTAFLKKMSHKEVHREPKLHFVLH